MLSSKNNSVKSLSIPINHSKSLSIYIRIILNYAQMISIIRSLELKWPYYVENYLNIAGNIGTVSPQLFSLECIISDYNLSIDSIYFKPMLTFLIYVAFLFFSIIIFVMRSKVFKHKFQGRNIIITTIVLTVFMQPSNIKELSNIFTCQNISGTNYLTEKMSLECYTKDHLNWVLLKTKIF